MIAVLAIERPAACSAEADAATHVVIANVGPAAVLIWNASPFVAQLVANRVPDAAANDRLEHAALRAIATDVRLLTRAKTITVRILYDKTGDVSPIYGSATFAGVERYANYSFPAPLARANANRWKSLRDADALPPWGALRVIGTLPPR